jgi:hypothetical protein
MMLSGAKHTDTWSLSAVLKEELLVLSGHACMEEKWWLSKLQGAGNQARLNLD